MNIETLNAQLSAEFGGPAIGALPAFPGDVLRPHKGGGGSNSSTTQSIPTELKPLAAAYSSKAMDLSNTPYQAYGGQQVAGMNDFQNSATTRLGQIFNYGDPSMNAARNTVTNSLNSGKAATENPYGYIGNGGTNQYAGQNQYLQQNIDAAMGDITRNYNDAVAPALTTQMVGSGSFGNTGNQAATQNSLNDLTKNLGNTAASMRMQDYTAQQGLAENQLNRNLQTNQFNAGLGQDYASRNDQLRGQMLGLAPGYESQGLNVANNFMNAANMYQDNSQQQLDALYQNWSDMQNDPYKKLAAMSGVFGSGLGNTTTTKQSGGGGK
ncbi:hypothetical protein [Pseudomonas kribbensis]|uniref:Uncharacterized protein n=1 Tax=Pseudomonas kribbensis TaxID=1628086 RepID=A0A4Y8VMS2_9PSED|nr:hypothetical protein [Pseudomonas kribbensis]TFH81810.1 hypothetical protein E4J90_09540 [Pseudomonas kribbensis]